MAKRKKDIVERKFVFTTEEIQSIIAKQSDGISLPRFMNPWFKNNIGVRRSGCVFGWTQSEIDEYAKSKVDIQYFANTYCKIKSEDGTVKQMKLRDYQYGILDAYDKSRFVINCSSRQTGKTITAAITILHYCLFNQNKGVMIVANKNDTVVEIIDKIKNIYQQLPFFLQVGIKNWNSKSVVFDNGCRIKSQARSKEPAIGFTIDLLYMDEFAHIPNTIVRHYYKAAVPTVSSIKNSKIIITSTPNGPNLFKELVMGSQLPVGHPDKNPYTFVKVLWWQVPGRLDTKVYPLQSELFKRDWTKQNVIDALNMHGIKWYEDEEPTDNGKREFFRIPHIEGQTEVELVRALSCLDGTLSSVCEITNWKEQETKLIGGPDEFSQEYDLQFVSGAKRILNTRTCKRLDERRKEYVAFETGFEKRLQFPFELKFHPDFDPTTRNQWQWFTSIDISEGLGQDSSVMDMYRLMVRSDEWLKSNQIKTVHEAFYLEQTGMYCGNRLHPREFAELFYLTHFEWLNPNKVLSTVEINGRAGGMFMEALPNVFEQNNQFGKYIFIRFKHNINDKLKKIGIRVSSNKKDMVKDYIDTIESDLILVNETQSIDQMDNFIKIETRSSWTYKADSGHDDLVMTKVNQAAAIKQSNEYKQRCLDMYNTLSPEKKKLINLAMNLDWNPKGIGYNQLSNAINRGRLGGKFGRR